MNAAFPAKPRNIIVFALFLAGLAALAREAVVRTVTSWSQEEYSHGYFIPFIAILLLLNGMGQKKFEPRNSWVGLCLLALFLLLQALLSFAGVYALLPDILLFSFIAGFAVFWGSKAALALAGPLGFLLFCAPLPNFFYYPLSFSLQMVSTALGTTLLEMMNISVFREGNIIDLGGYKLQVAEACSGLRYIFPLLSLSYLFAYLYKASWVKRVVLCLSSIPIAVLMNSLRIAVIGYTVNAYGGGMAEGPLHEFEGIVVFGGCALCLVLEVLLFQHIGTRAVIDWDALKLPRAGSIIAPAIKLPAYLAMVLVAVLLAASVTPFVAGRTITPVPLKQSFASFPMQLNGWAGRAGTIDSASLLKLGTEDYLLADYSKAGKTAVNLYILYYTAQDSSSNEAVHNPAVCIPAGGWTVTDTGRKLLSLPDGKELPVNKVVISKDAVRQVVYYWFMQPGHASASTLETRVNALKNALATGHTNGAMVRLVTRIEPHETEEAAERRMLQFLTETGDTVENYMFTPLRH